MPFSWKMIFIGQLSLGFLSETLRTHCMHFLQLGFNDFFSSLFGVMEMNSLETLKKSQPKGKTGRRSLKYLFKTGFVCVQPQSEKYKINCVKDSDDFSWQADYKRCHKAHYEFLRSAQTH